MHDYRVLMIYHSASISVATIIALCIILLIVLTVQASLQLRSHVLSAKTRSAISLLQCAHMPLSTVVRTCAMACMYTSVFTGCVVLTASLISATNTTYTITHGCTFCAKAGPCFYVLTKAWSYLFFFAKCRAVRPMEIVTRLQKAILLVTLGMVLFAFLVCWLAEGEISSLDQSCIFYVPPPMIAVMAVTDSILSWLYLHMFIVPLRAVQQANKRYNVAAFQIVQQQSRNQEPPQHNLFLVNDQTHRSGTQRQSSSTSHASGSSSQGLSMERIMHKNTVSCIVSVVATWISLGLMFTAHIHDLPILRKALWAIGQTDLALTAAAIAHLMHSTTYTGNGANFCSSGAPDETLARVITVTHAPAIRDATAAATTCDIT